MILPAVGYRSRIFDDRVSMDRAAADLIVALARDAIAERGQFSIALSGGDTPRGLYGLLATETYRGRIDWQSVHVFWADERCVPPDHADSNYGLAAGLLLSGVASAKGHIHRIQGEDDPAAAAAVYDKELRSFFGKSGYTFDLALLGVGADGHTASIFPGRAAMAETRHFAVAVPAEGRIQARVTMTLPGINGARTVLFLAAGSAKAPVIRDILEGTDPSQYPAGLVRPENGKLIWFLDRDAARLLRSRS